MPDPHPDRADSLGLAFAEWCESERDVRLRDWQRLVSDRLLEVDAEGRWCWRTGLVIVPRQVGKTRWSSLLVEWMAGTQRNRVIVGAHQLDNAKAITEPIMRRLHEEGYRTRFAPNRPVVWWDDDVWLSSQATTNDFCRGYTVDCVLVDEVQAVDVRAMAAALPAQSAVPSPLMLCVGTAPTVRDNGEMYNRIREAGITGAGNTCLIEWSAPTGCDWRSEEMWRRASPYWTPERLRVMRDNAALSTEEEWRSEYLCQSMAPSSSAWLLPDEWDMCRDDTLVPPGRPLVVAVESPRGGRGGTVAVGWREGDTRCVKVTQHPDLLEAWRHAPKAERTVVGADMAATPQAKARGAASRTKRDSSAALTELRRCAPVLLRWSGDTLARQALDTVVVEDAHNGLRIASSGDTAALRTAAWCVLEMQDTAEPTLA